MIILPGRQVFPRRTKKSVVFARAQKNYFAWDQTDNLWAYFRFHGTGGLAD